MVSCVTAVRDRTLLFLTTPALWPAWPFLPVVRRSKGYEELGVLFDSQSAGLTGYSARVVLCNLFALPADPKEFLTSPNETFDCAEELVASGWCVD